MIDSHAHIFSEYYENIDDLVEKLKNNNIKKVVNCATCFNDIKEVLELSKKYPDYLYPAIGIHPENIEDYDIERLKKIIQNNKIIAIGEIGLDYYWNKNNKEEQKRLFENQILLAEEFNLPIIVHSRESIQDCYDIIKKHNVKGVIHCFTGSYEMAKLFIKLGFKLGIGGVLTFKNSKLYEIIQKINMEDIVLETDSPYLSPEPNRGKKNDSSNLIYIAKKIAEIKEISVDEVISKTAQNTLEIFDF